MNPYEVLGVNPNDDEETIKKAYRSLVKKYHPDRYANSPLAEEAGEKLKEINLAYDMITGKAGPQEQGYSGSYGPYSGPYGSYSTDMPPSFSAVRTLITMRMFTAAAEMLSKLPQNAEWYYLMGVIYLNRGWYQKAREYIEQAADMDPGNMEYQKALDSFQARSSGYTSYSANISPIACCLGNLCCASVCSRCYLPLLCFC